MGVGNGLWELAVAKPRVPHPLTLREGSRHRHPLMKRQQAWTPACVEGLEWTPTSVEASAMDIHLCGGSRRLRTWRQQVWIPILVKAARIDIGPGGSRTGHPPFKKQQAGLDIHQ
jgi:hypothetical protein